MNVVNNSSAWVGTDNVTAEPIAVVGMAGRFPGADDVDTFWRNIQGGVDTISRFSDRELEDNYSAEIRGSSPFVPARPILEHPELFDAGFFGMYPREAALTDPQHRIFLECAWEAIESAGYDPTSADHRIGVVAGCSMNTYFLNNVCGDRRTIEDFTSSFQLGDYPMLVGAGQDFLTTRVAYKLDLRGPAMTLGTACSTSLTAVAQACQILQARQADMMLAGGVSITFPQKRGYLHTKGGMASADGTCRPFDAEASGTVFGSGAGVVLLKRLSDALADRDTIHAVIRGVSSNNDGARKVGFTAPSIDGQVDAIRDAHRRAGVDARTIGYVECHGTATPLGDPIEAAALTRAFEEATEDKGFCALGSAKANVGHLDAAAGVTGLIKAVLSVRDGVIPPLAHFTKPNPLLNIESGPFYLNADRRPWPNPDVPRRAGVTALGVGGTNVHVVIEEPPDPAATRGDIDPDARFILPLSARTPAALQRSVAALATYLERAPSVDLGDVAHTLQNGRRRFDHRAAIVGRDRADAVAKLRDPKLVVGQVQGAAAPVIFMCPGQGAQYAGMGRGLYATEPLYRDIIDEGAALLKPLIGRDLRDLLCVDAPDDETRASIHATRFAQPALFLTEYATAQLWVNWGVSPDALVGHSVGEIVCATLSGVISFDDALTFVAERGRLMQAMPPGGMMAVRLSESDLTPLLPEDISIAAVNGPRACVVAGPHEAIAAFKAGLDKQQIACRPVQTSHAFHSAMMDSAIEPLERCLDPVALAEPTVPFVSGVSGSWADPDEVRTGLYWARHCRSTVRFADALSCAVGGDKAVLIEVGPGGTLGRFAAQILAKGTTRGSVASLPDESEGADGRETIRAAVAAFWRIGGQPDWAAISGQAHRRVPLPTYPFERQSHWIEAPTVARAAPSLPSPEISSNPSLGADMPSSLPVTPTPVAASPAVETATARLVALLQDLSGDTFDPSTYTTSFLDLGFDSLFLAQLATQVQSTFGVPITFRQLFGDFASIDELARHLAAQMPAEATPIPAVPEPAPVAAPQPSEPAPTVVLAALPGAGGSTALQELMRQQLATVQTLFAQQLQAMGGGVSAPVAPAAAVPVPASAPPAVKAPASPSQDQPTSSSRLQVYQSSKTPARALEPLQRTFIADLIQRYTAKTPGSKKATAERRAVLADPRAAAGFRQEWKEMVYPILCTRSQGSRIWDVDGNDYIDLVNGYGQTMFGHVPRFVTDAVAKQLDLGFAIGPQSPLAGDVADRIHRLTGNERVTFCNTGSEAVMAAMRVARTVTGRGTVVMFEGAYHGQFDEVLVKGARAGVAGSAPAAAGIPTASVSNMVVLPYATDESLAWVRDHAATLAAVIVEPVQSRHPSLVPRDFIAELRAITAASGTALVFDEVVTGFRTHPGGMQAVFGIRADLATYGKVVGGGMPIGVLAGSRRFMDALDGGQWRFGDDSCPEVAPTFFAGTFVRHPLTLAAAQAVLIHVEQEGAALQETLAAKTARLVESINADLAARGLKSRAETFKSWFFFNPASEDRLASLFFIEARWRGLHIQEGFPCFLTTAHSDADFGRIETVFRESLDALAAAGILSSSTTTTAPAPGPAVAPANAPLPDRVPWTEPQKEIWLTAQLGDAASCSFNESVSFTFEGKLDETALRGALDDLMQRHDALRACFDPNDETMYVAPQREMPFHAVDISDDSNTLQALEGILEDEVATPFDLVEGPLVRAILVTRAADHHVLVLTAHHIICDGWSINVLTGELATLYAARRKGEKASLPEAPSFRTYALDQKRTGAMSAGTEAYWLNVYRTLPPPVDLPADRSRTAQKTYHGATHRDRMDAQLVRDVKAAGSRQGCTLFATLLGALQIVIARLSGEDDIVVAIPTAGQSAANMHSLVGHCVNLLPLRAAVARQDSLAAHLKKARDVLLDGFEHQDCTFGTVVHKLDLPRSQNRLPLTQIQFNLEKLTNGPSLDDVTMTVTPNGKEFSNFDLFVNMIEHPDGIRIDCDYNTDLFDADTIARWMEHMRVVLRAIADDATQPVWQAPLMSADDCRWLTQGLNRSAVEVDLRPVHVLIAERAAQTPGAMALAWRDQRMTFAELEAASNRLARYLLDKAPMPSGRIAVATSRSPAIVIAILAVLKAGHAYVPLDIMQPEARQRMILDDAKITAVLCDTYEVATQCSDFLTIDVVRDKAAIDALPETALASTSGPDDTAYVIFTSGSTGRPKGVEIPHRALVNLLQSMASRPGFSPRDIWLAVTTIGFDIAGAELLVPLVAGGRVVIADRAEVVDGFALVSRIIASAATVIQATPSLWRMLTEAGFKSSPSLKMIAGGEALPRDLADRLLEGGGTLWNAYGPTETTIWSSFDEVLADGAPISIGEPAFNTQLHVLDESHQLAPLGVEGELFIGGIGLAKGYYGRDDLTAEAFRSITLPTLEAQRLYKTGDRAKRLTDGRIVVLGRDDGQVKLRGFRIELGEIETVLRQCPGVEATVVALKPVAGSEPRLVAYVVAPEQASVDPVGFAARHLPDYMVPKAWMRLDAFPLNANGKLDRKALPEIAVEGSGPRHDIVKPETPRQIQLAKIFCDVLRLDEIGIHDNLFSIGADSIQIFRIAARLRAEGLGLDARDLMRRPTISELAETAEGTSAQVIDFAQAPTLRSFRRRAATASRESVE